ncbi:hypothetical protein CPHO_11310 [Corynebacterium phocae]|uniref:YoaR-like putative peptidoglycan binding domain-containing protein n=1 Tax=Corynebacterium phocae TaxID=161895 RepID=A0A1L7D6W0_9CORY|nr:hypothetical protein CPHO_11310 [Corynebacterium phocae]KAA8721756.1 hypothetical protein F4V58_10790 [Corynebacterium phocae]
MTAGLILGLLLIAGVAYGIDVAVNQGKVPRGTSVGGVDISAMDRDAAVDKLSRELGGVEAKPVAVRAGDRTSQLVPEQSGLSLDLQAAVDGIGEASLNPISRIASFFKPAAEIPVAISVDEAALNPQLDRVRQELEYAPQDGALVVEDADWKVIEPVLGQRIEPDSLRFAVVENWLNPEGVVVEPEKTEPVINKEVIKNMKDGDATAAFSRDIVVNGREDHRAVLDRGAIAQFVAVNNHEGNLVLDVDVARAQELIAEQLGVSEIEPQNARLTFSGDTRTVTPHQDGVKIDWEQTMDGFRDRVLGDDRTFPATYKDVPATFTTEIAQKATFDEVAGEFTTSGFSGPSGENIRLVAQEVDGAIVGPGETFSLNGYTGTRGAAQGYVESGIIINGRAGTAVGGGISQFATTLYNAAYFAGMEDVTHTPHSYYISRYPAGREATVYEGVIDLQFKNTTGHPVRIDTSFGNGSITVRLMGVKTVEVTSTNNGRWAQTQPTTMNVTNNCIPSSGAPGFTTSDTRTIRDLAGNVIKQETQTTVYDPIPIVRCG